MNNPVLYAKANPFQYRDADHVLKEYQGHLLHDADTDNILDIGCGSGNVTRSILAPFCRRYRKFVAVDISDEMIEFARQQDESHGDIFYEVLDIAGDVRNFRSFYGGFSKVFSFYCLHWVKDLPRAVGNIASLMITGGECLLVFVAQCPVFDMYEKMADNSNWEKYMQDADNFVPITHHSPQPAFMFSELMIEEGLHVEKCEVIDKEFTFPSVTVLKDCMCAVNPFLERIPEEKRNSYIMDCLKTLASLKASDENNHNVNSNENAGHSFKYKLLVAQGRKF